MDTPPPDELKGNPATAFIAGGLLLATGPLGLALAWLSARGYREGIQTLAELFRDSGGFVTQRVVATIVNIACDICQQGICSPRDLETAVTLGLGYPLGPLAMGDRFGPANVLEVLFNMQTVYGDPRYRPSPWLRRRGAIGLSLMHVEA